MSQPKTYYKWRPHPWHGISPGAEPPVRVNAYIEISPSDGIKYEIDKETGYLKVDRPQLTSSLPPALYGFIPRTYCGNRVAAISGQATHGDHDPLDICVLSERQITRAEVLAPARVIGGLRVIDRGEADDKIIAVLESDPYFDQIQDLSQLSTVLVSRLQHYFLTYKLKPGQTPPAAAAVSYGLDEARKVVEASLLDYLSMIEQLTPA